MGEDKKQTPPEKQKEKSPKPWWESEWFIEWERLARKEYHGKNNGK
jgi:hypothetical protein